MYIAGRVSVGDRSELGMVNLRSIGDIATESESCLWGDTLLDGEWLVFDPFSIDLVSRFNEWFGLLSDGSAAFESV